MPYRSRIPYARPFERLSLWGLGILSVIAGCGGATAPAGPTFPQEVQLPSGPRVLVLPRPLGSRVELALWLDAGSRDAASPAVATLAAWSAAQGADDAIDARVFPDGTLLRIACDRSVLKACVTRLGAVLATRRVAPHDLETTKQRFLRAQQLSASDAERTAQHLALEALLGKHAPGFLPLDGDPATLNAIRSVDVEAYLRDHYGPQRTLLLAAGDIGGPQLARIADSALGPLPQAGKTRDQRRLRVSPGPVRATVDATHRVTLALAAAGVDDAAALARNLASTRGLNTFHTPAGACAKRPVTAHVVPVRGGAIVLTQLSCRDIESAVAALSYHAARARFELEPLDADTLASDDGIEAALESLGQRWVTSPSPSSAQFGADAFGVGVTTPRASTALASWQAELEQRRQHAVALAQGATRGAQDSMAASVVASNQARIEVRRRIAAPRIAIAVGFYAGAAHEPVSMHGRSALLAQLATTSCRRYRGLALQAKLRDLNATLEPRVTADYWGIVLRAPRTHWTEALDLALACAFEPAWQENGLLDARQRVNRRLLDGGETHWLRSHAARVLTPQAPGLIAPWGTVDTLANVDATDMEEAWRISRSGARLAVGVVGDIPVSVVVARVARRVAGLPAGQLPVAPQPGPLDPGPLAVEPHAPRPRVIVGWRTSGRHHDGGAGPRAFAAAIAESLAADGLSVRAHAGSAHTWGAWAAVTLEVDPAQIPALPERVRRHVLGLSAEHLSAHVRATLDTWTDARQVAAGEPGWEAEQLVSARFSQPQSNPERFAASLEIALSLRGEAIQAYVIAGAGRSPVLARDLVQNDTTR